MKTNMQVVRRAAPSIRPFVAALVVLMGALLAPASARAARLTLATGTSSAIANSNLVDAGPVPSSQAVNLMLALKLDANRSAALDEFLASVVDSTSNNYHKWLTPQQFAATYGAPATQVAAATAWAQAQGLTVVSVSSGATHLSVTGTAAQVQAAFAVSLHVYQGSGALYYANATEPSLNTDAVPLFTAVSGLDNLPTAKFNVAALGQTSATTDAFASTLALVDANSTSIVTVDSAWCSSALAQTQIDQYRTMLRQANAQGITVLASSGCGAQGSGSFPASLPEATAVLPAGTLASLVMIPVEARPDWQVAPGLPADSLRHEPDLTASSLSAFAQTISTIAVQAGTRLGNVNATLYTLAPIAGLYAQTDAVAAGTWEAASGLGTIDLDQLVKVYPRGAGASFTSFSATNYAPTHGQATTFSSTVTSGTGGSTPTGTVTFELTNGTILGTSALTNGSGSYTTNSLAGGTYTVMAVYAGDPSYATSSSPSAQISVLPEASSLSATISGGAIIGSTLSVVVVDTAASGVGQPTGIVTAMLPLNGSTYSATLAAATTNSASATILVPATTVGTLTLSINCTTTVSFSCYNPYTTTFTVSKATPTLSISYTPNPPISGATITLNANVAGVGTAPVPTGNVVFYDNGTVLNAGALGNGATTTTGSTPSTSTHQITATYDGDANYNQVSTSGNSTTSGAIATTTALTSSATTVAAGANIIFTATVTPASNGAAAPSGLVQFYDGSSLLGTASLTSSVATFSTNQLAASANHSITAVYVGDTTYTGSTSPIVTLSRTTAAITTTTTLVSSASTVVVGQIVSFTATITPASTGSAAPSGSVEFFDGSTALGSATVSNNTAIYSTSLLSSTVSHSITAVYLGDNIYSGSTSSAVVVNKSSSTTTSQIQLTASPTSAAYGTAVLLTAVITPVVNSTPASGTISFTVGGSSICTAVLAAGTATCSVTTLPLGTDSVIAAYAGDTNYTGATSSPSVITITAAKTGTNATTTVAGATPATSVVGATVALTATVSSTASGTLGAPTGSVVFSDSLGGNVLCTAQLTSGAASCSTTAIPAGSSTVTGVYSGDANYTASTSAGVPVIVTSTATVAATLAATLVPNVAVLPSATASISATVTAPSGTIPAGAVDATITGGNGTVFATTLVTTTNAATATIAVTAPATAGTYSVVVSCATTNVTCAAVTVPLTVSTTALIGTSTVLKATPASTTTANPYTLTATITPQATGTSALSGTVSFYSGTTLLVTAPVSAGVATASASLTGTTASLTAVYSGDTLYATSTSAAVSVGAGAAAATITLTSNISTSLSGIDVIFTAQVSGSSGTTTIIGPTGTISFYDNFGGTTTLLGTVTLVTGGPALSTATLSTTGLKAGTHQVYAVYSGDTNFATATSSTITLSQTDYNAMFNPTTLTLKQGSTGTVAVTVASVGGFAGNVSFSCVAPVGSEIGCTFSPSTIANGGTTTMTIATTLPHDKTGGAQAANTPAQQSWHLASGIVCAGLLCLLLPRRRKLIPTLLVLLMGAVLMSNTGCAAGNFPGQSSSTSGSGSGISSPSDPGTPIGTVVLTVNSVGTDGVNEVAHTYYYQVTIQ